jgi:chemotaxis protein CheY-P-specific phosphatase CheC
MLCKIIKENTNMRLDKLNEISKAAAIKASSALSKLIQQPVGVDISPSSILDAKDFWRIKRRFLNDVSK